jgi:hypothetical protein
MNADGGHMTRSTVEQELLALENQTPNLSKATRSGAIAVPSGSRWVRLSFVQEVSHADE